MGLFKWKPIYFWVSYNSAEDSVLFKVEFLDITGYNLKTAHTHLVRPIQTTLWKKDAYTYLFSGRSGPVPQSPLCQPAPTTGERRDGSDNNWNAWAVKSPTGLLWAICWWCNHLFSEAAASWQKGADQVTGSKGAWKKVNIHIFLPLGSSYRC